MNFLKDPRTNWKYILIVVILAVLVGGGILWFSIKQEIPAEFPKITKPEKIEDKTANWKTYKNEKIGFEAKRLENWIVDERREELAGEIYNRVIFWLPEETVRAHEDLILSTGVSIEVERRTKERKYKDTNDYLNEWKSMEGSPEAWEHFVVTRNFVELGFVNINGVNFYKYKWTHQAQGLVYLTVKNGDLIGILFQTERDLLPIEKFSGYSKFEQFLATFRFLE